MQPKYPLFVRAKDSGELASFNSVYELQTHVEKIDIENREYEAWDSDGFRLALSLQAPVWLNLGIDAERPDPEDLDRALHQFASSVGVKLPDRLSPGTIQSTLAQIRNEY